MWFNSRTNGKNHMLCHRFILLEADTTLTPWSRICISQADCILLVAAEGAAPEVSCCPQHVCQVWVCNAMTQPIDHQEHSALASDVVSNIKAHLSMHQCLHICCTTSCSRLQFSMHTALHHLHVCCAATPFLLTKLKKPRCTSHNAQNPIPANLCHRPT